MTAAAEKDRIHQMEEEEEKRKRSHSASGARRNTAGRTRRSRSNTQSPRRLRPKIPSDPDLPNERATTSKTLRSSHHPPATAATPSKEHAKRRGSMGHLPNESATTTTTKSLRSSHHPPAATPNQDLTNKRRGSMGHHAVKRRGSMDHQAAKRRGSMDHQAAKRRGSMDHQAAKRRSRSRDKRKQSLSPKRETNFQRAKSTPNDIHGGVLKSPVGSPDGHDKKRTYQRAKSSPGPRSSSKGRQPSQQKLSPKPHATIALSRSPSPRMGKHVERSPSSSKQQQQLALVVSSEHRSKQNIPYLPLVPESPPPNKLVVRDRRGGLSSRPLKSPSPSPSPSPKQQLVKKSSRKPELPRMVSFDPKQQPPETSPLGKKTKLAIPVSEIDNDNIENNNTTNSNKPADTTPETPKEWWMKQLSDDDFVVLENDSKCQMCLRYFRIIAPNPDESPIKRRIRHLIWSTLIVDFIVALVSVLSYGEATTCCGEPIFSLPGIELNDAMNILMYIYMIGLVLEIHPVVREGPIPWNLLNPIFGFFIGFVVFVDDSPVEAVSVWILDLVSIVLECVTLRYYLRLYRESEVELEAMDGKLAKHPKRGYKRITIQRERREMREQHSKETSRLRRHMIGVVINLVLLFVTLLLIIFVAKSGGMCVKDNKTPNIFRSDQQDECELCDGRECQVCDVEGDEETQCYFPYF
eukprot:scaffold1087_cov136-Cylindrotheca_fusiformis.AAC.9